MLNEGKTTIHPVKSNSRRVLSWIGWIVVSGVALALGVAGGIIKKSGALTEGLVQQISHTPPKAVFGQDELNLLVLGCDVDYTPTGQKITNQKARSDMIMVAHMDLVRNKIGMMSIARDLYYKLPGYTFEGKEEGHKLNAYHAYGGDDLSKRAIEGLLGIKIDRVVTINFDAFQEMVDKVGGVTVTVDKQLDYDDNAGKLHIHLKPGLQHLDGYQSMGFVRFRHSDSDMLRQKRQQQFLLAMKDQIIRRNLAQIGEVISMGQRVLGDQFDDRETAALALFSRTVPRETIQFGQFPVVYKHGSSFLYPNKKKLPKVLASLGFLGDQARLAETAAVIHPSAHATDN